MVDMEMILNAVRQMSREEIDQLRDVIEEAIEALPTAVDSDADRPPFAVGLHDGAVGFNTDDFNAELPDDFWFGQANDPLST